MQLNHFEWNLISIILGIVLSGLAFFFKKAFDKLEKHDEMINIFTQTFATKEELKSHTDDINYLKQTYISKKKPQKSLRSRTK